jgi:integrase
MNRPLRRADSTVLYFRKRVPEAVRAIIGGPKELKISLRTRDPQEAKAENARLTAEFEARWVELRRGVRTFSQKDAERIAGEIYREIVTEHEENPGETSDWQTKLLLDHAFLRPEQVKIAKLGASPEKADALLAKLKVNRHAAIVQDWLDRKGYRVDDESLLRIKKAVNRSVMFAREQLQRNADGDYRPDPKAALFPAPLSEKESAASAPGPRGSASPLEVFDLYAKEAQVKPSTIKRWRPIVAKVQTEHPALSSITTEWAIAWKGRLVDSGLDNNTIRNAYLAAMRTMCKWAAENGHMAANPFATVTIKATKKGKTRSKGFVDAEAATILRATLDPVPEGFSAEHAAARRWVPWLCAYLGARVGEVGQLRGQDIKQEDGVWLVWITPEAGSTKTENARYVALHPHLIEQGFLAFVQKAGKGPLFYDPGRRRGGSDMNPQYKKIGERIGKWVRELGVDDPSIMPNHGWRHRFKTVARKVKMDVGARDYMQGHVPATEGEAYGDFPPDVLLHEISKLPQYEVRDRS